MLFRQHAIIDFSVIVKYDFYVWKKSVFVDFLFNNLIFLQLTGSIEDCDCTIDKVNDFNNKKIYPRLQSLLVKDYFRFFKVNLKRECPFWPDDGKCAIRYCSVQPCEDVSANFVYFNFSKINVVRIVNLYKNVILLFYRKICQWV